LFYLGEGVFHLDRAHIQTLMYLKLSVAGHLTIFLTRTRGPLWSIRPARVLWVAVLGTQIVATLIAVYGLFMTPLGWGWALFVWGYALVWFLVNDRVKLLAYRIFDPVKAGESADLTPQIAKRAYELYEERGRKDSPAVQDWEQAEREIRKKETKAEPQPEAKVVPKPEAKDEHKLETKTESEPEAKAKPQPEAKVEPKPEAKVEPKPEAKEEPKAEAKAQPEPEAKPEPKLEAKAEAKPETKEESKPKTKLEPKPEAKSEPKAEAKVEDKPEAKAETPSDLTPGLVKRVHELYENLGRKDLQAVEDMEKAERENRKDAAKAEAKPDAKAKPKGEM
jgi:H+-transporting ATPase